ncbi:MAG TPA: helix-hairpin-helix domain-containing protein [Sumerlaeia bacterium]|nr:helix-hairpin-helix domain-containing protein [Sumerlaeia bacterium]
MQNATHPHSLSLLPRRASFAAPRRIRRDASRGSILLLVLVLLSVLSLFATMLIYTAKVEKLAADNIGLGVQARTSAVAASSVALDLLRDRVGRPVGMVALAPAQGDDPGTPAATDEVGGADEDGAEPGDNASERIEEEDEAPQSAYAAPARRRARAAERWLEGVDLRDQCALVNVNWVDSYDGDRKGATVLKTPSSPHRGIPAEAFESLIAALIRRAGIEKVSASDVARNILKARDERAAGRARRPEKQKGAVGDDGPARGSRATSKDRAPNRSGNRPKESPQEHGAAQSLAEAWEKRLPYGENLPFYKLDELRTVPGVTDLVFQAIAPYFTTFSSNLEVWQDAQDKTFVRASLNDATADELVEVLRHAYPGIDKRDLEQFALNLVDRRDADSIPSRLRDDSSMAPALGFEMNLVVSEVCPDVISIEGGDNGEYIEIHNPLAQGVNLSGWWIDWGTGRRRLSGWVQPRGYLVITDDAKGDADSPVERRARGMGSFVDVFAILPGSARQQLIEIPGMDVPDNNGRIQLFDNEGNLIDYLVYRNASFNGMNRGFHRRSLFSREAQPGAATPFASQLESPRASYERYCWQTLAQRMNQPFESPAEALTVPAPAGDDGSAGFSRGPLFPRFGLSHGNELDLRLLDCFTIAEVPSALSEDGQLRVWPPAELGAERRRSVPRASDFSPSDPEENADRQLGGAWAATLAPLSYGKINVNTASPEALGTLPGLDEKMVKRIAEARDAATREIARSHRTGADSKPESRGRRLADRGIRMAPAPFLSLSDFAANETVWDTVRPEQRLDILMQLSPLLTVSSAAYVVFAAAPPNPVAAPNDPRRSSVTCRSLLALAGPEIEVLSWSYWHPPRLRIAPPVLSSPPSRLETPPRGEEKAAAAERSFGR